MQYGLTGTVANSTDGVHILINADDQQIEKFYEEIQIQAPSNSIITEIVTEKTNFISFTGFSIIHSKWEAVPDLLITPDIALCDECRKEILDTHNRRKAYPFTTCLHCGPRYSIISALPYDRENTTMAEMKMCDRCAEEYHNIQNRRHYSQTNSCTDCAIAMHLYESPDKDSVDNQQDIINKLTEYLSAGKIAAVKGIGGYLILCDAGNEETLRMLRTRKHRPNKPFAVLYPDIEKATADLHIDNIESAALKSTVAPIVLCRLKEKNSSGICRNLIAPRLDKIGIMLPYSPLLQLISTAFGKALVATSANLSGSPIIYKDEQALTDLWDIADIILTYDREIVVPQDDSVWQYTKNGQRIVLRRSRGMAPDYYPHQLNWTNEHLLALGADMKSAFALHCNDKVYISQYLGDQGDYQSQQSYTETLDHLLRLFNINPSVILADAHPGYNTHAKGKELSIAANAPFETIQHHKAHFAAVLSENNLLNNDSSVLGFIWDGTGYGDDNQIWGGEVFRYDQGELERILFLDYFPQILGDKMSREPRLSAISLLKDHPKSTDMLSHYFSAMEWDYYQKMLSKEDHLLTSSMGRLMDGIAALLGICVLNTYEGQAAMELEVLARGYSEDVTEYYPLPVRYNRIDWRPMLDEMISDITDKKEKGFIAKKFYASLVRLVEQVSDIFDINNLAFSGGVFQNALLVEMISDGLSGSKDIYFHQQLSPNDECIALGQLALYHHQHENETSLSYSNRLLHKQTN